MKISAIVFILGLFLSSVAHASGVTLCVQKQCQPMTNYKTEEVMAQLNEIFSGNQREILFCSSDVRTRQCLDKPIVFRGYSNLMQVDFQILFARVNQIKREANSLEMILDYQIKANQYYPKCTASNSTLTLSTSWNGGLQLSSNPFNCRITELGTTQIYFQFNVDYINLDTGYFGGYYRTVSQGDILSNETTGYALFRLTNTRHIEKVRLQPENIPGSTKGWKKASFETRENKSIFDWTSKDWSEWWDSFSKKALKVIYLEPLDD